MPHSALLLAAAIFSGLGFACLGVAYRLGQARGVPPVYIALVSSAMGTVFFGLQARGTRAAPFVWALAVAVGATQYVAIKLVRPALARGPLSPLWCAISLGFIVVIAYAQLFLGETVRALQFLGVVAGIACVIVAALGQSPTRVAHTAPRRRTTGVVAYGAILLMALIFNSTTACALKGLSARSFDSGHSYLDLFGNQFYCVFYAAFGALIAIELAAFRREEVRLGTALGLGLFGGAGSVAGMWAWGVAAVMPAAIVFTVSSVVSIMAAAVVSVAAFRERASPAWYATIGLALLSVLLVNAYGFRVG